MADRTEPTVETARTVGQRIRAAYLAKGLNRSKLQRALGVAYTTILAWERDEAAPNAENLSALSVTLGVSPSWLLGEEIPVTEPQYQAWVAFLKSTEGQKMTRTERLTLGSIRFADDLEPTVEVYRGLLLGLRMGRAS